MDRPSEPTKQRCHGLQPDDDVLVDGREAALVTNNDGTPASIYTVAVAKGRDNTWDGAVDDLRINSKIYNFEPYGVQEINAS